ncbi:MAG: hypothetical protein DRJ35_03785 [Thermoprotei archaeon]|nr:MAG: hypothetical protein DRJ35_03785 [Thermoprotei archaeon]
MKKGVLQKLFSQNYIYVIYGPPLTYKTTIALHILRMYKGNKIYVGLGKHAYLRPILKDIHFMPIRDLKEELEFILRLPFIQKVDNSLIVYDGFGANLFPLRAFYPENVVMRLASFILAYLKYVSLAHSSKAVVVIEGGDFPLFKRVLQEYSSLFIKTKVSGNSVTLYVLDNRFSHITSLKLFIEEILEKKDEREDY